ARAYQRAIVERRPVVLMMPIDISPQPAGQTAPSRPPLPPLPNPAPDTNAVREAAALLATAQRPAIIAGRGARLADAAPDLEQLAQRIGAVLATSAPANGLFAGLPYALGISGGFASPFAAQILPEADVVLVAGASVNHWTTKHGALINPDAKVIQIDVDPRAIGRNRPADLALIGDVAAAANALNDALANHENTGFRTPELAAQIAANTWRD